MDSKLQELLEQKKALEREIRILKKNSTFCGCAKLDKEHFSTNKADEWYVAVWMEYYDEWTRQHKKENGRWRSIIRNPDKNLVISKIDDVIADLKGLKEKLTDAE